MSWLARSLMSSLRPDSDRSDDEDDEVSASTEDDRSLRAAEADDGDEIDGRKRPIGPESPKRGVKYELSDLTKTLTRPFWGVASFLAPPPSQTLTPTVDLSRESDPSDGPEDDEVAAMSPSFAGIRNDFAEIGGQFRTGISVLSSNKALTEISKIASNFLPFGSNEINDDEDEESGVGAVGVTDEVIAFVSNISMHPETWLDFPLLFDDEYSDDFNMSDAQQKHTLAIEHLAPRLAALRIELCPSHMSKDCFWKIYFVILHPRLNNHDAVILSTPEIVHARAMLLQAVADPGFEDLPHRTREGATTSAPPMVDARLSSHILDETTPIHLPESEIKMHPIEATEVKVIEKSVVKEGPSTKDPSSDQSGPSVMKYGDDGDEWLEEDAGEMGLTAGSAIPLRHDDDVSFSDLEDDNEDSCSRATSITAVTDSPKDESGWVQLNKSPDGATKGDDLSSSQAKEPNDWLNIDVDVD